MQLSDWEAGLFLLTIGAYLLASVIYIFLPADQAGKLGRKAAWVAAACHAASLVLRTAQTWQLEQRLPLSSQFELLTIVVFVITLTYLFIGQQKVYAYLGAYVMPIATAAMLYAAYLPREVRVLHEALQTYRRVVHVSSAIAAYAALLTAAAVGIMYLVQERRSRDEVQLAALDALSYKLSTVGFLFLTVLLVTGVLWAKVAWGRYWGWDPKETWALLTWFVYAVTLYGRRYREWKGTLAAWMVVFGFACVTMTVVGVRFVYSIHNY
ncbi:MAG: cytochrome c biogenesis protein CcsA [Bacillota bacterium]|nr:cytochrome c biogenesis protein CcsA [Bacillota bacterium]MDW7685122.1 cytochrome c biogenesis protein CcsA [Bacillota bacterium]